MPTTDSTSGPIPYVDLVIAGLGQVNLAIPLIATAIMTLFGIWKKTQADTFAAWQAAHPGGTLPDWQTLMFAKFCDGYLRAQATEGLAENEAWFLAHGYTKDESGHWVAPRRDE